MEREERKNICLKPWRRKEEITDKRRRRTQLVSNYIYSTYNSEIPNLWVAIRMWVRQDQVRVKNATEKLEEKKSLNVAHLVERVVGFGGFLRWVAVLPKKC